MNSIIKLTKQILKSYRVNYPRFFHEDFKIPKLLEKDSKENISIESKYKIFRDEDSHIIFDINEEKSKLEYQIIEPGVGEYQNINLKRGVTGVYEIKDLVDILQTENAEDIFVCSVPKHLKYVDYMCVVTGRSSRHMNAIAEYIRKIYKKKSNDTDILPKIEGEGSNQWLALDLGNIALHIFSSEARLLYDLESLWGIGSEYDKEFNKPPDSLIDIYEKHSIYLNDLLVKK